MAESSSCNRDRAFLTCTIVANAPIHAVPGEGLVTEMQVSWDGPAPQAGQFFMLRLVRSGVLLGRPISVFGYKRGLVSFLIAERGKGSRELVRVRPGEAIELSGPLGNTWPKPPEGDGPLALVGGGIGIAPLINLIEQHGPRNYHFFGGFRSRPYGLEAIPPNNLTIATEDGSTGHRGRIPDFCNPAEFKLVYACGPIPMLQRIAESCRQGGIPCYISLEERMACGVGACLGCTVRTTGGNRRCCVDGPIFPAEEVLFNV